MGCGCLGIVVWIGFLGATAGYGSWLLANFVSAVPIPPWEQAFWFAAGGAVLGMMIGAKVGSQSVLDDFDDLEEEEGVSVDGRVANEYATQAGSRAGGIGSVIGAVVGGVVFVIVAV